MEKIRSIWYEIQEFFDSLYNLITWFSIIWKDRQWDQNFFYLVLRKKLQRMEKFYRSPDCHHLESDKDADNIHYCIERLDRLIEENYVDNALKEFEKAFPYYKWAMEFKPIDHHPELYEWVDNDTPEQKELHKKCFDQAELDKENDLDELFAQIRLHCQEWWD